MIAIKKDSAILILNAVCLIATFGLVYAGRVTWQQAEAFVLGLVVPSGIAWGRTKK